MAANVALPTYKLQIGAGATSVTTQYTQYTAANYTAIADVKNLDTDLINRNQIDVSHFDSPNNTREFIQGMREFGSITFTLNWNPANATQGATANGLLNDSTMTTPRNWVIKFHPGQGAALTSTTAQVALFWGSLQTFNGGGALDGAMEATATIKIASDITWATGGPI